MSELLTRDEYRSIAAGLDLPTNAFINGRYQAPIGRGTMETVNPATGETLAQVPACDARDVDFAVTKAREAFERGAWSKMPPRERKETMIRLVKLIKRRRHEFAVLESLESGKPIAECANTDLPETLICLAWHAEAADKLYDQIAPAQDDALGLIVREPVGVVGCVLPWNFPLMTMAWKIGPALAGGSSVIVKPAEQTSMTALWLAELAVEAGVPAGVLNVLPGDGPSCGEPLGRHMDVDAISFTGSTEVGRLFLKYAAESNLKRIVLECGGKNAAVVLSDAENLDSVARHVVFAALWNMGQNCTANSRLVVHRAVESDLMARIDREIEKWRTGDPLDPTNQLGAIVSADQHAQIMGYIASGKKEGARLRIGGEADTATNGAFIAPTVFEGVKPDMTIAREEIFGPVLAVLPVDSDAEAIALANDTRYGLQASLFTGNLRKALRGARALKAGTVTVNCYGEGDITTPFGGYRQSGFGGRDNALAAHDQYTETKTIWIDLSDDHIDDTIVSGTALQSASFRDQTRTGAADKDGVP